MPDRLTRVIRDLPIKLSRWQTNVASPYIYAYDRAYESYQATLKAQSESDKAKVELLVLAASVATGSVMMAVFASSSLRVVAGRAMLSAVCNNNLDRTFNFIHAVSKSEPAMFALGKVLDEAKSQFGKTIETAALKLVSQQSTAMTMSTVSYARQLDDFLRLNFDCAHTVASAAQDSPHLDAAAQDQIAARLEQSPFFNPPTGGSIQVDALSKKIELAFFMSDVLDRDSLVKVPATGYGGGYGGLPSALGSTSTRIDALPSSPNYPRATTPKQYPLATGSFQYIATDKQGSRIIDRINVLSREVFRQPFYKNTGLFAPDVPMSADLSRAEKTLNALGELLRPRTLSDLRT